jgi:hypothetical protein
MILETIAMLEMIDFGGSLNSTNFTGVLDLQIVWTMMKSHLMMA